MLPCDVSSDDDIAKVCERVDQEFGGLDFLVHGAAFAPREELSLPFSQTTREGFRMALTPVPHMPGVAVYAALVGFVAGLGWLGIDGFRRRVLA